MNETDAIATVDLAKSFDDVLALDGVSLAVKPGEMFALVGPDGAGKTTFIRILCGIIRADSGSAKVLGLDVVDGIRDVRRRIGYLSQRFTLYGDLSVDENIEFFARIHGVRDYAARRNELLDFTRLTPFRERLAERLSGGMKQKLALACTLIHTPELIFLDEPTTGVDPVTRRDFFTLLAPLTASGTTIFLTTTYLDEAERCNRVAMMNAGRILACGSPDELRTALDRVVVEVICDPARTAKSLVSTDSTLNGLFPIVQLFGDRLDLIYEGAGVEQAIELLEARLKAEHVDIASTRIRQPSLENVFLTLMEREQSPSTPAVG